MLVTYLSRDDGRVEAELSADCDRRLFNGIAHAILRRFKGKLVERLDGFGERYWDIVIGDKVVTLKLYHADVSLCSEDREANGLIREVAGYLEGIEPTPMWQEVFFLKNFFRIRKRRRTKV